jgi:hypothetical protein
MIFTNTPKKVFQKLEFINKKGAVDFNSRIKFSESVPHELLMIQSNRDMYCVYIGHQKNLRQRFSEHFIGSKGTGLNPSPLFGQLFLIFRCTNYAPNA